MNVCLYVLYYVNVFKIIYHPVNSCICSISVTVVRCAASAFCFSSSKVVRVVVVHHLICVVAFGATLIRSTHTGLTLPQVVVIGHLVSAVDATWRLVVVRLCETVQVVRRLHLEAGELPAAGLSELPR